MFSIFPSGAGANQSASSSLEDSRNLQARMIFSPLMIEGMVESLCNAVSHIHDEYTPKKFILDNLSEALTIVQKLNSTPLTEEECTMQEDLDSRIKREVEILEKAGHWIINGFGEEKNKCNFSVE